MDFRYPEVVIEWAKSNGMSRDYDLISLAGAQKAVLDEDTRETVFKQLKISTDLHGINRVVIVAHQDCGAYGGSAAFKSLEEEKEKYADDMRKAAEIIREQHPQMKFLFVILLDDDGKITFEQIP